MTTRPGGDRPTADGPAAPVFRPGAGGPPGPGGRPPGPGGGRGPGMMGMGMGLPPAKAKDFRGSLRRLFGTLGPERPLIVVVVLLGIVSVTFNVIGPKILVILGCRFSNIGTMSKKVVRPLGQSMIPTN